MKYFDNTRVSSAKNCLRQYFLRHNLDWVRDGLSPALGFGLSWHDGQDAIWAMAGNPDISDSNILGAAMQRFNSTWAEQGFPLWEDMTPEEEDRYAPRTPGIAAEMFHNYIAKRRGLIKQYEVVAIEQPFAVPIFPDRDDIFYIGRFDKVIREPKSGKIILIEHKTTTSYKKGGPFRTDYLESWSPNSQIDGYLYAANMLWPGQVKEVWVDAALVHKQIHDGFKFVPINRATEMMDSWLYETRFWINLILAQEEEFYEAQTSMLEQPFMSVFPKNTGACTHYAGCSFRDICKSISNPALVSEPPLGYKKEHWSPFDVLELDKIGMPPEE